MKYNFDNLIDVKTGKQPVLYGCGCDVCVAKLERIKALSKQASTHVRHTLCDDDEMFDTH